MNQLGRTCLLVLLCFFNTKVFASEIVLSGNYQGRDLFVQNPFNKTSKKFCTEAVYVNDRKVFDNPTISAYKVDLSYLKIGDLVVVRIEYSEGCEPSIVNPQALKAPQNFQFLMAQADHHSIVWSTKGELPNGQYFIEHKWKNKDWAVIDTLQGKGNFDINRYSAVPNHKIGLNKYRVRYSSFDARSFYSLEFEHESSENYITFYPKIATTSLRLSDSTKYTIQDYFGKVIKEGSGKEILLLNIKQGKYYLIIQNRKEQFIKR